MVLERMSFWPRFIDLIKLCYTEMQVCAQNNGNLSKRFDINRGAKQGCPLNPLNC